MTDEGPHPSNETGHVEWKTLPFNVACFSLFGCFPSSGPGCARSTFPVGEGDLPAGESYQRKSPRKLWWQLSGGEERKESGLLVVPVVVDEAAVGDTLENWECYTRMKGVELII